jgi:hypothetical protein
MRFLIPLFTILILICPAVSSRSVENDFNALKLSSDQTPKQYCYNYNFIDKDNIEGTILENDGSEPSGYSQDFVLYDAENNLCKPMSRKLVTALNKTVDPNPLSDLPNASENISLIINPNIQFIDENGNVYYQQLQSRDTIFYGGFLPFVAFHDDILANNDHLVNLNSVSLFLYFKKKF